jgi:hypothetical protein
VFNEGGEEHLALHIIVKTAVRQTSYQNKVYVFSKGLARVVICLPCVQFITYFLPLFSQLLPVYAVSFNNYLRTDVLIRGLELHAFYVG